MSPSVAAATALALLAIFGVLGPISRALPNSFCDYA